jgi:hypothetical protein
MVEGRWACVFLVSLSSHFIVDTNGVLDTIGTLPELENSTSW